MNLPMIDLIRAAKVALCLTVISSTASLGLAQQGYLKPTFHQRANYSQAPPMTGAMLAGGPAAAQGNQFMDVQGNSIVMPASYYQSSPTCYNGYPGGATGDPMAVDFGGYGQDQCGPHYFDISADVVFLQGEDLFNGVASFGSVTAAANAPKILDPNTSGSDYEPGWRITGRYDVGALAVLEATYMGLYDLGFNDRITSAQGSLLLPVPPVPTNNQLQSVFSGFGAPTPIAGLDAANVYSLNYEADLQSTEFSYRRYWLGNNPRVSGTWLIGARYIRLTESIQFNVEDSFDVPGPDDTSSRLWDAENDMVGFQLGGDGWISLRQGLRVGGEMKAGIYNNRFKFRHAGDFPEGVTPGVGVDPPPADFSSLTEGNQVAFAAEGEVSMVIDILPSWSIRGGYQVLFLNSLATVGGNIDQTNISNTAVLTQADAVYHGFHGGVEWIW